MPSAATILPLLAQEAAPAGDAGSRLLPNIILFGAILLIFWFLVLQPQRKQEKVRRAMLDALKKKDRVLTSGGILGTVQDLRDDEVTLRVSENPDVKVRVRRSAVVEVLAEPAAGAP